ncbi:trehalase [Mucilaginibacter yixingensis]|uniref:Trehalase n=1 Tax=Mucilaginibacter yixingensis TaxID=1295612 RepID=A0A2T5JFH2_9SPHI|nr:trehalase family glycosidase [Mucilaginibacter yixingensis]PTR01177.1 trehalase [Mucilaginibacter yixingensis]
MRFGIFKTYCFAFFLIVIPGFKLIAQSRITSDSIGSWQQLDNVASLSGKSEWRPMLTYVAKLHKLSTHAAIWPFDYEWEGIGPGYVYGEAFGHWDIVHIVLDEIPSFPQHALHQLFNDIKNQEPSGLIPGSIYMPGGISKRDSVHWDKTTAGHPPLWPIAVQDYIDHTGNRSIIKSFYPALIKQIAWFEKNRKAGKEGFFYNDILLKKWESGVDEGVRFDDVKKGPLACVDATSHVYNLYKIAALWSAQLGLDDNWYKKRRDELKTFIQNDLYVNEDGMFYDIWAVKDPSFRHLAFESMWPLVVGAATKAQANRYIDKYLMNPNVFLTAHPIATIGKTDPKFEKRMWRGPAWNSMSYWAAIACLNYGRKDGAKLILEKALDETAKQFKRTGTIWEFYDSLGGNPEDLKRKPQTKYNSPSKDYLGHNPLIAMAILYDSIK